MFQFLSTASVRVMDALQRRISEVLGKAPFITDLGVRLVEVRDGRVRTELALVERLRQQHGFAHAGVVTTLADHTAGAAASTVIGERQSVLTADFSIQLMRPAAGELLTCVGDVLRAGRSLIFTQSDVWAGDKHCARYAGTMAVVDRAI